MSHNCSGKEKKMHFFLHFPLFASLRKRSIAFTKKSSITIVNINRKTCIETQNNLFYYTYVKILDQTLNNVKKIIL